MTTAKHVLDSIVAEGRVTRGWIGVEPRDLSPELAQTFGLQNFRSESDPLRGVIITGVLQGGPASNAGVQPGDVITAVSAKRIENVSQLLSAVAALPPGKAAKLSVVRRSERLVLDVIPGVRPRPRQPTR